MNLFVCVPPAILDSEVGVGEKSVTVQVIIVTLLGFPAGSLEILVSEGKPRIVFIIMMGFLLELHH